MIASKLIQMLEVAAGRWKQPANNVFKPEYDSNVKTTNLDEKNGLLRLTQELLITQAIIAAEYSLVRKTQKIIHTNFLRMGLDRM